MKNFWKKYRKRVGLFFGFFTPMFCFSGIVLNYRTVFSKIEVNRNWMPENYHYKNWNNGIIKGTLRLPDGRVLIYGNAGVWQIDSCLITLTDFNQGLVRGIDNREISNIIRFTNNDIWRAELYSACLLGRNKWQEYLISRSEERVSDITQRGDTLVVLIRSNLHTSVSPYHQFERIELKAPASYSSETSLFCTIWLLHSGELFGTPDKLVADFPGIALIILSITGIIYTLLPSFIRRRYRERLPVKTQAKTSKTSLN